MKYTIGFLSIGLVVLLSSSAFFTVTEGQQALIVQFGRIVGQPITEAGLHSKIPLIQSVRYFDKRILHWDGDPNQIPTKDKKYIWVDTTARWRIVDAVKFAETVQNFNNARERLDAILDGKTRDVISKNILAEAVRNSNRILEKLKDLEKNTENQPEDVIEEAVFTKVEPITVGRENISKEITENARKELGPLGIELIDVQLRSIAYEKSVEHKVFERMISERKRIAEKIRSIGKGEQAKIQGKMALELNKIESEAYRESEKIRGKGEAEAMAIYARALNENPQFYEFVKTLDVYKKTLPQKGEFVLSTNSDLLKLLSTKQ